VVDKVLTRRITKFYEQISPKIEMGNDSNNGGEKTVAGKRSDNGPQGPKKD
jgi:hypothetical protein